MNKLLLGDNLEVLRTLPSESVDLIYLDPPFFSNRHYECIWGDKGEVRSFEDRWSGGIEHYIAWLKERVQEMHRILKPTGSIYLHCDWHADAYIRVYILDPIFGVGNFVNEIIWKYNTGGASKSQFSKKHDSIFLYAKDNSKRIFNPQKEAYREEKTIHFNQIDSDVRAFRIRSIGGKDYKYYLDEGRICHDTWDLDSVNAVANERCGYPTQKPEALLQRIIAASSNEGDVVLDPFVGGGTTIAVANKMGRNWIGIDQSATAIRVSESRVNNQNLVHPFEVVLHKYDYDALFTMDAFKFERWIVEQFGGTPNEKQRGDKGLDGRTKDGVPIQVKQSEGVGRNVIDNLKSAAERQDKDKFQERISTGKPVAYLIAFSFGKGAAQEVARLQLEQGVLISLVEVGTIVALAKRPSFKLKSTIAVDGMCHFKVVDVVASSSIAFYSWDWDYQGNMGLFKPEVQIDKIGEVEKKFAPGTYTIAVKAVDENGLETIVTQKIEVENENTD